MNLTKISWSSLSKYTTDLNGCRRLWAYDYHPDYKHIKPAPTKFPATGKKLHKLFHYFFDHYQVVNSLIKPTFILQENDGLNKYFKLFLESEQERYSKLFINGLVDIYQPAYREYEFNANGLNGIVDRIDQKHDKTYSIGDYKPNKTLSGVRNQLAFYSLGLHYENNINVTSWWLYNYSTGKTYEEPVSENHVEYIKKAIAEMKKGVAREDFRPVYEVKGKVSWLCEYCGYLEYCDVV